MCQELTVDQSVIFVGRNLERGGDLAEERDNGLAGVTTDNGNLGLRGVLLAGVFLSESLGTNNVQGGDTEEALRVKDASALENLSSNGDGRVDRVRDDQDESLGAVFGNALDKITDDASVDLEQVVTGHTRLPYNGKNSKKGNWANSSVDHEGKTNGECQRG